MGKLVISDILWNEIQMIKQEQLSFPPKLVKSEGLNLLIRRSVVNSVDVNDFKMNILNNIVGEIFNQLHGRNIKYGVYQQSPENIFLYSIVDGIIDRVIPKTINHSFVFDANYKNEIENILKLYNPNDRPINFHFLTISEKDRVYTVFIKFDIEEHDYIDTTKLNETNVDIKLEWEIASQYKYNEKFSTDMNKYFDERKKMIEEQEKTKEE